MSEVENGIAEAVALWASVVVLVVVAALALTALIGIWVSGYYEWRADLAEKKARIRMWTEK